MTRPTTKRVEFTRDHDQYLMKFLASYNPTKEGRSGKRIYDILVANERGQWPWAVHHTAQSWRERYVKNAPAFDLRIENYQKKHGIVAKKRFADEPIPIEPPAKRVRLDVARPSDMSQRTLSQPPRSTPGPSGSQPAAPPAARPIKESTPEPPPKPTRNETSEVPSSLPNERPSEPATSAPSQSAQPAPSQPPPPSTAPLNTPPIASSTPRPTSTQKSTLEFPPLTIRKDTLELPSSSPEKPTPAPPPAPARAPDTQPTQTPSRPPLRKRQRSIESDLFASVPPSPRRVSAPSTIGPSSQAQPHSQAPSPTTKAVSAVYSRVPPRLVDSFHGTVMVDQKGRVPRIISREEDEEEGEKEQWPPVRRRSAKGGGKEPEINGHHPFSQPQPRPEIVTRDERERKHPFSRVGRPVGEIYEPDRRTVVAQFGKGIRKPKEHEATNGKGKEREKDRVDEGIKPAVVHLPPPPPPPPPVPQPVPEPRVLPFPKQGSKGFIFPAPRASTRSPFRPELPRQEPPAQAVPHPALSRVRRQTIAHAHENVPSVDLVTMSRSTSGASSNASAAALTTRRPPRWSLPANATPWGVGHERAGSRTESPFRWAAPSPLFPGLRTHTSSPSLANASSFLPPPLLGSPGPSHMQQRPRSHSRPGTGAGPASATTISLDLSVDPHLSFDPHLNLTPHPTDLTLTSSHGLASILAHMSANHGLAMSVVQAVYKRVGSLREADEVLRGMREAAEGFGQKEIERRMRGRGGSERERGGERGGESERAGGHGVEREGDHGRDRGSSSGSGSGSVERGRSRKRKEREGTQLKYVVASEDGEGSEYAPPETSRAAMWKRQEEGLGGVQEGEGDDVDAEVDADAEADDQAVDEELREEEDSDEDEDEDEAWLPDAHHDFSRRVRPEEDSEDAEKPVVDQHHLIKQDAWEEESVAELLVNDKARQLEQKVGRDHFHKLVVRMFK